MQRTRFVIFCLFGFVVAPLFSQEEGNSTYYAHKLKGRHTADGGKYHPDSMTCAHRTYPFGTLLKVTNTRNNREVIVKVTDRGPFTRRFIIDVSYRAAQELDFIRRGITSVVISVYRPYDTPLLRSLEMRPVFRFPHEREEVKNRNPF